MNTTKTTHTQGPWKVNDYAETQHDFIGIVADGPRCIANITTYANEGPRTSEDRANATLIAAAPEMLTQHKTELTWLLHIKGQVTAPASVMLGFDQAIRAHEMIIAKAEGR